MVKLTPNFFRRPNRLPTQLLLILLQGRLMTL